MLHVRLGGMGELPGVLTEFARRGVSVIVIDGGDGTVQAVLTEVLTGADFAVPPRFAVIASGMTNLIAGDVGLKGKRAAALDRLAGIEDLDRATVTRPAMRLDRGAAHAPVYGMFFGAAAVCRGIELARKRLHPVGFAQSAAVGAAIPAVVLSGFFGAGRADLMRGERIALSADGMAVPHERHFLLLASTLDRLALGLRPFWGEGDGGICWLGVAAPPRRLTAALLPALRGRPRPWMREAGYRSGRALTLRMVMEHPFTLDGEAFDPGPDGVVTLTANRTVDFVRV